MNKYIIPLLLLLQSCASIPAVRPGFNIDKYNKIGVMNFISSSSETNSGYSVSDEFIRQLIRKNKKVIEISQPRDLYGLNYSKIAKEYDVDAIISGTVIKYVSDAKDTVYFKDDEGKVVSEVFFEYAEIGVSAKLVEASTGEVLWSDTYNYSGFNIDDTIAAVVSVIVDRMGNAK